MKTAEDLQAESLALLSRVMNHGHSSDVACASNYGSRLLLSGTQ
jgi:hypothetical protein